MAELDRCIEFLRELAVRCAQRTVESRFGIGLFYDDLPRVWSLNYLLAERALEAATAEELAGDAERVLGAAGLAHRKIEVLDGEAGARLEPEFRELGWLVEADLIMVARRPPTWGDAPHVEELTAEELAPVWAEGIRSEPAVADEGVVQELIKHKFVLADAIPTRFFGVRVDGEVASYCDLYATGGIGQIEGVMTLEQFRNRGLARAVVSRAMAASLEGGNDLTFLLAMRDDWPKELYRKLGFEEVGLLYEFRRPS